MEAATVPAPAVIQLHRADGSIEPGSQAITYLDLAKVEVAFDPFVPGVTGIQKAQHGDLSGKGHPVFHGAFQHAVAHELDI